jgi:hypothetical protein
VQTKAGKETYPLDNITGFNIHLEPKPPEKFVKSKVVENEDSAPIDLRKVVSKETPRRRCQEEVLLKVMVIQLEIGSYPSLY